MTVEIPLKKQQEVLEVLAKIRSHDDQAREWTHTDWRFSSAVKRREIKDEPFNRKFITPKKGKQPKRVEPGYLFPNRQQLPVREAEV